MEESCESQVTRLWGSSMVVVLDRLRIISKGLNMWSMKVKRENKLMEVDLKRMLESLNDLFPSVTLDLKVLRVK